jgi:BetI-type transcriptional repressor, C-terminal
MWRVFEGMRQQTIDTLPPERLRRLMVSLEPIIDETSNWIGLYADFFNQAWQKPTIRDSFREFYVRYIDVLEPIVQQGIDDGLFRTVDPLLTARMLVGALDGYWFQQILDVGDAQPVLALYGEIIIRGLMKDDAKDR